MSEFQSKYYFERPEGRRQRKRQEEDIMAVKVQADSEGVLSGKPAEVRIYENDRLITKVVAKIELKQGADGGYYHCVVLTEETKR
jgi:hypothetical protein